MGDLSANFSRREFACKCGCGFDTVDVELLQVLQDMADHFSDELDRKIMCIITSGCRCKKHNRLEGGEDESKHLLAIAADIVVGSVEPIELFDYFDREYPSTLGIILYDWGVHVDVRQNKFRGDNSGL